MKRCPACAENIQNAAAVCRYCGHRLTETEISASKKGNTLAWVVGGGLFVTMCSVMGNNWGDKSKVAETVRTPCNLAAAQRVLSAGREAGFILGNQTNGISVDERVWRSMSLGQKRTVALAVACDRKDGVADPAVYVSIRASDGITRIASGSPFGGTFSDAQD
jgi:hypothetical protein